jgi:hypothetical protein
VGFVMINMMDDFKSDVAVTVIGSADNLKVCV